MSKSDIEKTLLTTAQTFLEANGFSGKIQSENSKYEPEIGSEYAALFFVPNTPVASTMGMGGNDRENGFLQIDFNIPILTGTGAMRAWTDAAYAYFVKGRSFTFNSQKVTIVSCGENGGKKVDNWYRKSLTITYRSDLIRPTF